MTVTPQTIRPGGSITVTGKGFVPNATVHVSVPVQTGSSTTTVAKDVTTDDKGNFSTTLDVPQSARVGTVAVTASDVTGQFSTTAKLAVTPVA